MSEFLPVCSRYFVWTRPGIAVMVDWALRNSYLSSPVQGWGVDRTSKTVQGDDDTFLLEHELQRCAMDAGASNILTLTV